MARMYDRPTLGPDGWVVDETRTPPLPNVVAITDPVTGGITFVTGSQSYIAHISVSPSGDTTGATDATNIQAAMDAVYAAGGGVLELGIGDFYINTALVLPSNVEIRGQGIATKISGVSDMVDDDTSNIDTNLIHVYQVSNAKILNMQLDGVRTAATTGDDGQGGLDAGRNCIRGLEATDIVVSGVWAHDAVFHGLKAERGCNRWIVTGNRFSANGFRGIHSVCWGTGANYGVEMYDQVISGNKVHNNGASDSALQADSLAGLFCGYDYSSGVIVSGNNVFDENGVGIEVRGSQYAVIALAGNITSGSAIVTGISSTANLRSGMYASGTGIKEGARILNIDSSTQVTLTLTATTTTATTISYEPLQGRQIVVTGNTIRGCAGTSLSLSDWARNVIISNNVIVDGEYRAVSLDCAASERAKDIVVTGNTITNHHNTSQGFGVYVDEVSRVTVSNNTISGCGREGVAITSSNDVVVQGNVINSSDSYCVRDLTGTNTIVMGNQLTSRATVTVDIGASSVNPTVVFNYVTRTGTGAGIVNASPSAQIFGNRLGASTTITAGSATGPQFNVATASGSSSATMTNAPTAGDPSEWISVVGPSGAVRSIPAW